MKRFAVLFLWTLAVTLVSAPWSSPNAALMNVVQSPNGLIDTAQQREWLRISFTRGLSYTDITGPGYDCNPVCASGPFSGWTFAYDDAVRQLYRDAFDYSACSPLAPLGGGCAPTNGAADYLQFLADLGTTFVHEHFVGADPYSVFGFYAVSQARYRSAFDPQILYEVDWVTECFQRFAAAQCSGSDLLSSPAPSGGLTFESTASLVVAPPNLDVWPQGERGVWLYRQLPEPSTVLLLGTSLVILIPSARRWTGPAGRLT